jgi:hypothetical protein
MNKNIAIYVGRRNVQRACVGCPNDSDVLLDLSDVEDEDEPVIEGIGMLVGVSKTLLAALVGAA